MLIIENVLALFVIKLLSIGPFVALLTGLVWPRWYFGIISSLIIASLETLFLQWHDGPSELAASEWQVMFGYAACLLTFALGRALRVAFKAG